MKKIIIAGILVLIACVIGTAFLFLSAMTDPTPPQVRVGWYLPQQDIVWTKPGFGTNPSHTEHLVLSGELNGPAPQFPELSPYCRYENYTQENTGRKYMIAVWYFNEVSTFVSSQKKLQDFLITSGTITEVTLNFTGVLITDQSNRTAQDSFNNDLLPASLTTTGYENEETSGLFFIVEIPGPGIESGGKQNTRNNEHYIVYYGTSEPATLSSRTDLLRDIIGHTYAYDRVISAGPL
jgi:hypothetical protein